MPDPLPTQGQEAAQMSDGERLHYALALLSGLEFNHPNPRSDQCPICGWPMGGHHGTRHEPGCSLETVLTGRVPHRLIHLEQLYGDAAYGFDGQDRRRFATPIVPPLAAEKADQ